MLNSVSNIIYIYGSFLKIGLVINIHKSSRNFVSNSDEILNTIPSFLFIVI